MRIILVSTNAGTGLGGEAIKAYQYFQYLLGEGRDVYLLTHARCREALTGFDPARVIYVEDDLAQRALWRSRILGRYVTTLFHIAAARLIRRFDPATTLIHYLCPISPAVQRFPPRGYRYVVGPLSGNISYPPGFAARAGTAARVQQHAYPLIQGLSGRVKGDMKRARHLLVSGGERTREALRWAGCSDNDMTDVADAGVGATIATAPGIEHLGENPHFVWIGRFIDYKGADLAIRALARTEPPIHLTLYGDGPLRQSLQALARDLDVADRAAFPGWLPHDRFTSEMSRFRGFVFPTLAEANGIVMQEAMMLGLPVVALRWGGPTALASDSEAIFVEPTDESAVVNGLAHAMTQLAHDPQLAQRLSDAGRVHAKANYTWQTVAASWERAYAH